MQNFVGWYSKNSNIRLDKKGISLIIGMHLSGMYNPIVRRDSRRILQETGSIIQVQIFQTCFFSLTILSISLTMELQKRQPAQVEMLTAFMGICTTTEKTTFARAADAGWRSTIPIMFSCAMFVSAIMWPLCSWISISSYARSAGRQRCSRFRSRQSIIESQWSFCRIPRIC